MKNKTLIIHSLFLLIFLGNFVITSETAERKTPHFFIDYIDDPASSHYATKEYIDNVATIAEEVWNHVIVKEGYKRPPNVPTTEPLTDAQKITINVRNISDYGETNIIGKDGTTIPVITIDNDYSTHNISGLNGLRISLIHEFFHAVQQSYANAISFSTTLLWFWEGTAAWIEDEPVTLAGVNIDTINSYILDNYAENYLSRPEVSLDDITRGYDNVLFYKYLTEQNYSIKQILENYDAGNYTTANNDDMLRAIGQTLGDPAPNYYGDNFKNLFNNFIIACYMKTGNYGFEDDGAVDLPDVTITEIWNESNTNNIHYIPSKPTQIGKKMEDDNNTPTNPDDDPYPKEKYNFSHLSARYFAIRVPNEAGRIEASNYDDPIKIYHYSYAEDITNYNVMFVKRFADTKRYLVPQPPKFNDTPELIKYDNTYQTYFGGKDKRTEEIIFMLTNTSKDTSQYIWYSAFILPVFQHTYKALVPKGEPMDYKTGTTPTIKCLNEDNIYNRSDIINLEIDLSEEVTLEIVMLEYNSSYLKITPLPENKYEISYTIPKDVYSGIKTFTICAWDLTRKDYNTEKFVYKVDEEELKEVPPFLLDIPIVLEDDFEKPIDTTKWNIKEMGTLKQVNGKIINEDYPGGKILSLKEFNFDKEFMVDLDIKWKPVNDTVVINPEEDGYVGMIIRGFKEEVPPPYPPKPPLKEEAVSKGSENPELVVKEIKNFFGMVFMPYSYTPLLRISEINDPPEYRLPMNEFKKFRFIFYYPKLCFRCIIYCLNGFPELHFEGCFKYKFLPPFKFGFVAKNIVCELDNIKVYYREELIPEITKITPNIGIQGERISVTIEGKNFQKGLEVKLERINYPDIIGENVEVYEPTKIICIFNLKNVESGYWNLVVINPDGRKGVLRNAFRVLTPKEALEYSVDKINNIREEISQFISPITNSLLKKLDAGIDSINRAILQIVRDEVKQTINQINAAINQLNALINEIEAQTGKKIPEDNAKLFVEKIKNEISWLNRIINIFSIKERDEIKKVTKEKGLLIEKVYTYPNPYRGGVVEGARLKDGINTSGVVFRYKAEGNIQRVIIEVYNLSGRLIDKFEDETIDGEKLWSGVNNLANGVYIYRILISDRINTISKIGKLAIIK